MRDDVADIIATLHLHYTEKSGLTEKLSLNETQLFFSVKAGNTDNAVRLLEEAQWIIDKIDHIDALIGGASDALKRNTGIEEMNCIEFLAGSGGVRGKHIIELIEGIRKTMEEVFKKRSQVNDMLDRQAAETGKNIEGLARLRKIRYSRER